MVATGPHRQQAELRKGRRKTLHYPAWILTGPKAPPRQCMLWDVSDAGARVTGVGEDLPEEFILLLSKDGSTRRRCRQVWRADDPVGVEFLREAKAPARRLW